jgi:pseudoazurin
MRIGMFVVTAAAVAAVAMPVGASAKDHTIKMLNNGSAGMMVFEPAVTKVAPGDTVTFVAVDKGHNVEAISSMLPPGAATFKGKMNQNLTVKFTKPGTYGFKCLPHYGMGMVGAIIVGNGAPNLAQAKAAANPGLAKKVFARILN